MELLIVIPAYNEARVIGDLIRSIPRKFPGISKVQALVVDDNSSDNTQQEAEKAGALCIRHEMNLGAGGATVTGFEAAKKLKSDIVVTMDGDGQHDPADISKLISPIIAGRADAVIGSRLKEVSKEMPFYKTIGNNIMNVITFVFFRIWVSDSQSGFKAFSKKALNKIELYTKGYEFCSELIGQLKAKKIKYVEVPINTIYTDYSKSKGQLAINAVNIITALITRKIR